MNSVQYIRPPRPRAAPHKRAATRSSGPRRAAARRDAPFRRARNCFRSCSLGRTPDSKMLLPTVVGLGAHYVSASWEDEIIQSCVLYCFLKSDTMKAHERLENTDLEPTMKQLPERVLRATQR